MFRRLYAKARHDGGVALVAVIALGAIMILVAGTALGAATSGLSESTTDTNATGALDAAYAGVQDYLARVNIDSTYTQYRNPSAAFSSTSTGNPPSATNPALDASSGGTWQSVAGASSADGDGNPASFRYEVDNSSYPSTGIIRIRSTGRVGAVTRSVIAYLKQQGFISYLYFTNYETTDPKLDSSQPTTGCDTYAWAGRSSSCTSIQFASNDKLSGPVHSNDTMVVCGNPFLSTATSSSTTTPIYRTAPGCSSALTPTITYSPLLAMPSTNASMRTQTRSDLTTATGCLYTGPTSITFNGDGTMTVVSPWTKYTNVTATSGSNPTAQCGALGALHSTAGATIPVLPSNLVYVQNVPTTATDPNYSASTAAALPTGFTCIGSNGTSTVTGSASSAGWSFTTNSKTIGYPLSNEIPASKWTSSGAWSTSNPAYGCRNGDAYVKGAISGRMTIASENYIYVTGDITYVNPTNDVLGLVGNNAVIVWNPMKTVNGTTSAILTDTGRTIDAALLSVAHTFTVQNYNVGSTRGYLTVLGSIAQNFRGPVATSNGTTGVVQTGYVKNYLYDQRLTSVTPPYFLQPSNTYFTLIRYAGAPAAYTANGAPQ